LATPFTKLRSFKALHGVLQHFHIGAMGIQKLSSIQRIEYTTVGLVGNSEIDNRADTLRLGANCLPIYFTVELCDVASYLDSYNLKKDISIDGSSCYCLYYSSHW
jgi:hypothetical protein